jgi:hypothetical protein
MVVPVESHLCAFLKDRTVSAEENIQKVHCDFLTDEELML